MLLLVPTANRAISFLCDLADFGFWGEAVVVRGPFRLSSSLADDVSRWMKGASVTREPGRILVERDGIRFVFVSRAEQAVGRRPNFVLLLTENLSAEEVELACQKLS